MKNKKSKMKINIKKILIVIFLILLIIGGYYLINNKEEIYEHFSENINIGIKNSHEECRNSAGDCILYYYISDENDPNYKKCYCFKREHLLQAFTGESLSDADELTDDKIMDLINDIDGEEDNSQDSEESQEELKPVDCKGAWSPCDDGCIKRFTVEKEPKNNGKSCPIPTKDKLSEKIIIEDTTNSDGKRVIHQICEPGEDSSSWHDYMCNNQSKDESKLNSGCKGYKVTEINNNGTNDNDNIEVKTVQPAADVPGPSWVDVKGSTGARSLADFGAYKKDLGCYLKYDNYGAGASAHGNENLKMNGVVVGSEEEVKNICAERCYASQDCNHFQTWSDKEDEKLDTSQPYSCCLYNIDESKIPKNSDGTPFIGKKGKGKMWKIRNIHEGKLAVFGKSKSREGVIKRVYKLNTIPVVNNGEKKNVCGESGNGECRINRESKENARYKMRGYTSKCSLGSISGRISGSEVKDNQGNIIIEGYQNLCDKSKLRILLLILIIFIAIYCLS